MVRRYALSSLVGLLVLAGCTVGPDYHPKSATELGVPDGYSVHADKAALDDNTHWWTKFDDPLLGQIVEQGRAANLDIGQAIDRLRQARESLIQARSAQLPQVTGQAGYTRNQSITGSGLAAISSNSFSIGADVSYQADIFGGVRRNVEAARASYQSSGFASAEVMITVESEIARNYVLARQAQANLANARNSLAIQDDNLKIAGWRVQAGLATAVDAESARAQQAQTAATIPSLEANYNTYVSELGLLTGQAPGALKSMLEAVKPIPTGPAEVATGIPADTLRQRPDVREAERNLAASTAQIGVATAQLYPALSIGGSLATGSTALTGLFQAISGQLFANVAQTIFDGGRLHSVVRSNRAAADAAFLSYKSTVLSALQDIENAIVALHSAQERERDFTIAREAANNQEILARFQYQSGLTDFTTLNQAETQLLSASDGLVQARSDKATALIQLYLSLGGGWDSNTIPEAPANGK